MLRTLLIVVLLLPVWGGLAHAVEVQRVVSPGGIEAWLVEDHSNPILSVSFTFEGGSAAVPKGKGGLAEMVSGLLDEGAGDIDSKAFQQELADRSIGLSFDAGRDEFSGSLVTLTRERARAFELLRLAMAEPRFDPEPVERIRQQLLVQQARRAQNPNALAWEGLFDLLFGDQRYAWPSVGTAESVGALSVDDLRWYVKNQLVRDRLYIGVAGDITPAELGPLLDEVYGALPKSGQLPTVPPQTVSQAGGTAVIERQQPQSVVAFGQVGVKRDDPDFYAATLINYVLGGGTFSSRLYEEIREKRGLAYSVSTSLAPMDHAGLLVGGVGTANERVAETLEQVRLQWRRLAEEGPTAEELEAAKAYVIGAFPLQLSSTGRIASVLVSMQREHLGLDYIDRRPDLFSAVTLEQARALAKRLLHPDQLKVVVVGQPAGVEGTLQLPPAL